MKSFKTFMREEVTQKQIQDLEKFADRLLDKFDVDVEFSRHFADRMNDSRNNPNISVAEIQKLFKKIAKRKAKGIKQNAGDDVVLKDIQSDLNLPIVVRYDRNKDEYEIINKTIMRKKDFKTTSKVIQYEDVDEEAPSTSVASGNIDMNPNGFKKRDRRNKYDTESMYRRNKGTK